MSALILGSSSWKSSFGADATFVRKPNTTLKLCFLFFANAQDLGWTYSFNLGRLQTQKWLQERYQDFRVTSTVQSNVYFGVANKTANALGHIQNGCNVIVANNELLMGGDGVMDAMIRQFTNVSFIILAHHRMFDTQFPNCVFVGFDFSAAYYVAGVTAALEARRCVGFIAAWEDSRNPNDAVNGFIQGVRRVNATLPIHVVTMDSWYSPAAEMLVAELLADPRGRDCNVIARYTDAKEVDFRIAELPGVMSVGVHSNLQQYVGDSVLRAVYTQWSSILIPLLVDVIETGSLSQRRSPHYFGLSSGAVIVSPPSARASLETFVGSLEAFEEMQQRQHSIFCGDVRQRTGTVVTGANASNGCLTVAQMVTMTAFIDDPHTVFHPTFQDAAGCPAGTRFAYTSAGMLNRSCIPCDVGFFSETAGTAECLRCPEGTTTREEGGTQCAPVPPPEPPLGRTGLIAVTATAGFALVCVLVAVTAARYFATRKNRYAPRTAPCCIMFTDIEGSTELWQQHPRDMAAAIALHDRVIRAVIERNGAYEVKHGGDGVMIACSSVLDAVYVATEVQSELQQAPWPDSFAAPTEADGAASVTVGEDGGPVNVLQPPASSAVVRGLRVRIGLHWCMPREVIVKYERLRQYYDYVGKAVALAARIEAQARGGQILMDHDTYVALRSDEEFQSTMAEDVVVQLFARNVELKGFKERYTLYSLLPQSLANRTFAPLRGHEHDAVLEGVECDAVELIAACGTSPVSERLCGDHETRVVHHDVPELAAAKKPAPPINPFALRHRRRVAAKQAQLGVDEAELGWPGGAEARSQSSSRVDNSVANTLQSILEALPPAELAHVLIRLFAVHGLRKRGSNTKRLVRQLVMHSDGRSVSVSQHTSAVASEDAAKDVNEVDVVEI